MKIGIKFFRLLLLSLATVGMSSFHFVYAAESTPISKVMIVVFENADYDEAVKQPDFAKLASRGALFTNFHGEAHPSQPNYAALVSGSTHGVRTDGQVNLKGKTIADLLEAKRKTWKAYLEDYPGKCFANGSSGNYVRKHNPFISFDEIRNSPQLCSHLVSANELRSDLGRGTIPDFSVYIPDVKNDGHDTGVDFAGRWLSQKFLPMLGDPLPKDLLLIVTFDESGAHSKDNSIYTAFVGRSVTPGSRSAQRYDHYSVLRTIEENLDIGSLSQNDARAQLMDGFWNSKEST